MSRKHSPKPTSLITYLCIRCAWSFTRTEVVSPKCSMCGKGDRLQETLREPLTAASLETSMMRSVDRLMTNLQKAYDVRGGEWGSDSEEILMLEALAKAKDLETHVKKAFGRTKRKRIHVASVSL